MPDTPFAQGSLLCNQNPGAWPSKWCAVSNAAICHIFFRRRRKGFRWPRKRQGASAVICTLKTTIFAAGAEASRYSCFAPRRRPSLKHFNGNHLQSASSISRQREVYKMTIRKLFTPNSTKTSSPKRNNSTRLTQAQLSEYLLCLFRVGRGNRVNLASSIHRAVPALNELQ